MAIYLQLVQQIKKHCLPTNTSFYRCMSTEMGKPKSSLFISGERARNTYVTVIPHLDFDHKFANLTQLEENIKRRRLNYDVVKMKGSWEFYNEWNDKKLQLQKNVNEASKQVGDLLKEVDSKEKSAKLERLERYRHLLKEELQQVKKSVWDIEDSVIGDMLKLPNDLHPESPLEDTNLAVFDKEEIGEGSDHLGKGKQLDYLDYINELNYFLKNKAAMMELAVLEYFIDQFVSMGFIQFSNPDFTRSVLAEGVGLPPQNSSDVYLLEETEGNNDHLHLCGGASLFPFCGYHAKQSVAKKSLPVKYVASGRRYSPPTDVLQGLYSVSQSTSVQIFTATHCPEEIYHEFQLCVEKLRSIFENIGFNFKLVKQSASFYKNWDSLRVSVQVYSPYNRTFIEVGHVSLIDDFVSKRLRMCYVDKTSEPFLRVLSGNVINAQTFIALCLERSNNDLLIPDVLKDYMLA